MSKPRILRATIDPVTLAALRGIAPRQRELQADYEARRAEIVRDIAITYATIETQLGLEAGSILNGLYRIEGDQLVATTGFNASRALNDSNLDLG